jgi:hypothetical protein
VRAAARSLGAVWWIVIVSPCIAAAADSERIQSDRPSVSTSTYTVQQGAVQVESGVEYLRTSIGGSPAVLTSLAGPGPDYSLRAGLSVRFGR